VCPIDPCHLGHLGGHLSGEWLDWLSSHSHDGTMGQSSQRGVPDAALTLHNDYPPHDHRVIGFALSPLSPSSISSARCLFSHPTLSLVPVAVPHTASRLRVITSFVFCPRAVCVRANRRRSLHHPDSPVQEAPPASPHLTTRTSHHQLSSLWPSGECHRSRATTPM
jgi:hypothetical protein